MWQLCDLHGHFLPGMDDGCKTPEESVQVLQAQYRQGIHRVFATPHYYPVEPVEAFLKRRDASVRTLREHVRKTGEDGLPEICLGAEVAYRPGLAQEEDLEKLCLGNSAYLLLEMPFSRWSSDVIRGVRNLCVTGGVIPIIAHVERYWNLQSRDTLARILELDVLVQMNAEHFLSLGTRGEARKLVQRGFVQLLGSDCHNMTSRAPNLGKAVQYLEQKGLAGFLEDVQELSNRIFEEAADR